MNIANDMQNYLHVSYDIKYTTIKAPIFVSSSTNGVWIIRPYQIHKVFAKNGKMLDYSA